MIRVVVFLLIVAALAFGAVWLADRPGDITIVWPWLGQAVDVPLGLVVYVVALAVGVWLLRVIWRSPGRAATIVRRRRAARGFTAISRGLIAIGAGDLVAARRFSGMAQRYAGEQPLALLLAAQTAQLAGNRAAAEGTFRRMAELSDTRLLGLHGLFVEAQRRSDPTAARDLAEAAVAANPAAGWAAQAVLDFRCAARDWAGALAALASNMKSGLIDKPTFRRRRAVLLTARALSGGDRAATLADVTEAVALAPGLVPAAALTGRLYAEAGKVRRASRIIEAAWRAHPHPDLALTYAHVRPGDSARDRLARVEALARIAPDEPEGKLAVARAALDAREFPIARAALAPLLAAPTRRVALLMAELEEHDTGDVGRARQWMSRALHAARDPAWTADGLVSDKWLPVSPATGRLDAFQWKVPLADLDASTRVIDLDVPPAPVATVQVAAAPGASTPAPAHSDADDDDDDDAPAYDGSPSRPSEPAPVSASAPPRETAAHDTTALPVLPRKPVPSSHNDDVIPLMPSPDDPGPDADLSVDPAPLPPTPEPWWRRSR